MFAGSHDGGCPAGARHVRHASRVGRSWMLRRTHRGRRARAFCPPESLETRLLFAAGEPDTRFSQDGIVDVAGMQVLQDAHLAAGEKMLVVGGQSQAFYPFTTVARYTVAGELDPTFSTDGVVSLDNHIRP